MATPYVAGVAALMLAVNPDLTYQQLSSNIINSGSWIDIKHPSGFLNLGSTTITVRRLDAYEAVKAIATFDTRVLSDTTIEVRGTFGRQLTGAVTIPETLNGRSVTTIATLAFSGQTGMSQISIPFSVVYIAPDAFIGCSGLTSINVSPASVNYSAQDGILYNKNKTALIYVPPAVSGSVVIPSTVTAIPGYAFANRALLNEVLIPASVAAIGEYAFSNCSALATVWFAPDSGLTAIGYCAFYFCQSLQSIQLPAGIKSIGESAFLYSGLWSGAPDNSVVYVGDWAVGVKGNIGGNLVLQSGTAGIAAAAFRYLNNLTDVTFSDSIQYIGAFAFEFCRGLTETVIPYSVLEVGAAAFYGCSALETVTVGRTYTITAAGTEAFHGCPALREIIFPDINSYMMYRIAENWSDYYALLTFSDAEMIVVNELRCELTAEASPTGGRKEVLVQFAAAGVKTVLFRGDYWAYIEVADGTNLEIINRRGSENFTFNAAEGEIYVFCVYNTTNPWSFVFTGGDIFIPEYSEGSEHYYGFQHIFEAGHPQNHIVSFIPSYSGIYGIWVTAFTDFSVFSNITIYGANEIDFVKSGEYVHTGLTSGMRYYIVFHSTTDSPSPLFSFLTVELWQETEFYTYGSYFETYFWLPQGEFDIYLNFETNDMFLIQFIGFENASIEMYDGYGNFYGTGSGNYDYGGGRHRFRFSSGGTTGRIIVTF